MLFCEQESNITEKRYEKMRRKMLRTVGILTLSFVLSMGMAGCAEKGGGEPGTSDNQSVTLHDSDGIGSNSELEDGSEENSEPDSPDSQSTKLNNGDGTAESNEIKDSGEVESDTESVYFEGADLNGRVLEFSDTGFTITPIYREVFEDGTSSSWEAALGKEKEEDNIYITYTEESVFEVVYFDMDLQEVSSRENADKSSIKKQTVVYVFGSSEDGKNWTADKVIIQRWKDN